ncbi:MAG: VWA domain-containing protein, partial [Planctomycetia bacterium]|nr:VWA domain-containing protein [Planctomycetia bacterium]
MGHYLVFENPWFLLALPAGWLACAWFARRASGRGARTRLPFVLNALLLTLLVLAVSEPHMRTGVAQSTTVLAIDTSGSMRSARPGPAQAILEVRRALGRVPGAKLAVVIFGHDARVAMTPTPAVDNSAFDALALPRVGKGATNIAAGLSVAQAIIPPGEHGQIILLSDGLQTLGDAGSQARGLARLRTALHVLMPSKDLLPDARMTSIDAPPRIPGAKTFRINVGVSSTVPASVELLLSRVGPRGEKAVVGRRRMDIPAQQTLYFSFSDTPREPGIHTYRARVKLGADATPENDVASKAVEVEGAWSALYIIGEGEPGPLADDLKADPLVNLVVARSPSPADLARSRLVVLDNLSGKDLLSRQWQRLDAFVKDTGGALLVLGGDRSFGLGQYDELPIAAALPVVSSPGQKRAVFLVVVLDVSGSMRQMVGGTTKLAVAKRATLGLREVLSENDRVAVVAFSASPTVAAGPVGVSRWQELREKVLALQAGGGTRITPALKKAAEVLATGSADAVRHIILLSDGESPDFDADEMAQQFARAKVSVSALATGDQTNREKLMRLAQKTGGRFYAMKDINRLPATFLKDLLQAKQKVMSLKTQPARWKDPQPIWPAGDTDVPPVDFHLLTQAKAGARVHLAVPAGNPIIASWRYGLGKVVAMPTSLSPADNPAWARWPGRRAFLGPLINWLRSRPRPADWTLSLKEDSGELKIRLRTPAKSRRADNPSGFK